MDNSSVKFIRLVTGEDIIAETTIVDDNQYVLSSPMKVIYTFSKDNMGYMTLSLSKWILNSLCDDTNIKLKDKDVLLYNDASSSIVEHYFQTIEHYKNDFNDDFNDDFDQDNDDDISALEDLIDMLKVDKGKLH